MEKEATEKIENRKTEAPKNIRKENNRFASLLMGKGFPRNSTPMDNATWLKKMLSHQIQWTSTSPTTASSTFPFAADLFGAIRTILSCFTLGG